MPGQARRTTLHDVARAAGVSVATASRVLSDRGDFATATRARVLDAADALQYSREGTRRGRPVAQAMSVDFVVGDVSPAWSDRAISGAWRAATRHGLDLNLTTERTGSVDDWTALLARRRSRGVIFALVQPLAAQLDDLRRAHVPVVLLDPLSGSRVSARSVGAADWAGGYAAGRHLLERGATSFVIVLACPAYRFAVARAAGFAAAIEEARPGATVHSISTGWDSAGPVPGLESLLVAASGPTGVFASNDHLALRCYPSTRSARLRVGEDVLVVGFDDEPRAAGAAPPLTSVHQPIGAMAAHAVDVLADALRTNAPPTPGHDELPVSLVTRASTGRSGASPAP